MSNGSVKRDRDTRHGSTKRRSRSPDFTDVKTITTTYTVQRTDGTLLCDATGGAFTVTLPTALLSLGRMFNFKKIDPSANAVTITTGG